MESRHAIIAHQIATSTEIRSSAYGKHNNRCPVDAATARIYLAASPADQQKIQILLRFRLRELADMLRQSLSEIMDEIGAKAQERGLTPDILEELLRDE